MAVLKYQSRSEKSANIKLKINTRHVFNTHICALNLQSNNLISPGLKGRENLWQSVQIFQEHVIFFNPAELKSIRAIIYRYKTKQQAVNVALC